MSVYGTQPDFAVKEDSKCHPKSFYGVGKLASENYLQIYSDYGLHTTSLRLFNVYGPGQNLENLRQGMVSIFLAQLIKDKSIHVKGLSSRFRDFVYIDDVVDLFIDCLTNQNTIGEEINVGTGKDKTIKEYCELKVPYVSILLKKYQTHSDLFYRGSVWTAPNDMLLAYAAKGEKNVSYAN